MRHLVGARIQSDWSSLSTEDRDTQKETGTRVYTGTTT